MLNFNLANLFYQKLFTNYLQMSLNNTEDFENNSQTLHASSRDSEIEQEIPEKKELQEEISKTILG